MEINSVSLLLLIVVDTADTDRIFITVNANKRGPLIPANALVRF